MLWFRNKFKVHPFALQHFLDGLDLRLIYRLNVSNGMTRIELYIS